MTGIKGVCDKWRNARSRMHALVDNGRIVSVHESRSAAMDSLINGVGFGVVTPITRKAAAEWRASIEAA